MINRPDGTRVEVGEPWHTHSPGMKTHNGIAVAGGAKNARFTDSEGNMIVLIQSLEPKP